MISINSLTVAYGGFTLLNDINFHISESDKIGLVGKNGAGKSTILKLICGYQNPTTGKPLSNAIRMSIKSNWSRFLRSLAAIAPVSTNASIRSIIAATAFVSAMFGTRTGRNPAAEIASELVTLAQRKPFVVHTSAMATIFLVFPFSEDMAHPDKATATAANAIKRNERNMWDFFIVFPLCIASILFISGKMLPEHL